jgi:hypothetical protein
VSRGLGRLQGRIVRTVDEHPEGLSIFEIATAIHGIAYTRSQYESTRRATWAVHALDLIALTTPQLSQLSNWTFYPLRVARTWAPGQVITDPRRRVEAHRQARISVGCRTDGSARNNGPQCVAYTTRTGRTEQCKRPAAAGSDVCAIHVRILQLAAHMARLLTPG